MDEEKRAVAVITALPHAGNLAVAVIHVTMGLLAGLVALGLRGDAPDTRTAVRALREQPFGPLLLLIVAAGSLCLVLWRLLQTFADLESKGTSLVGLCQRARYLFGALVYLSVPLLVARLFLGSPVRSGEQLAEEAASAAIQFPFGWSVVLGTGMGFLIAGVYCLYKMCRGNFEGVFHCERISRKQRLFFFWLGRLGYAARGSIFLVIGYYLTVAGWNLDPRQVEGQAGALHIIGQQPFGPMMLGIVSLGLIALGAFSLAELRYGKLPVEKVERTVRLVHTKAAS